MQIIISPTKKMNVAADLLPVLSRPNFLPFAEQIQDTMKGMQDSALQTLWQCNDKLAALNCRRVREMDVRCGKTPALLAYEGIAFQSMGARVLTESAMEYVQRHLVILSALYGALRPYDGIVPYRLEMQAALSVAGERDLYRFWGNRLYAFLAERDNVLLNLASKEYADAVMPFVDERMHRVDVKFGNLRSGRLVQKATYAKISRGELVRYIAEGGITDIEDVKGFKNRYFHYDDGLSSEDCLVFSDH